MQGKGGDGKEEGKKSSVTLAIAFNSINYNRSSSCR